MSKYNFTKWLGLTEAFINSDSQDFIRAKELTDTAIKDIAKTLLKRVESNPNFCSEKQKEAIQSVASLGLEDKHIKPFLPPKGVDISDFEDAMASCWASKEYD